MLDILVQERRSRAAAKRFSSICYKSRNANLDGSSPDGLRIFGVAAYAQDIFAKGVRLITYSAEALVFLEACKVPPQVITLRVTRE